MAAEEENGEGAGEILIKLFGAKGLWRYYWRLHREKEMKEKKEQVKMAQHSDKLFNKTTTRAKSEVFRFFGTFFSFALCVMDI